MVDDRLESPTALLEKPGMKITLAAARNILGGYDFSNPILLMPYLSKVEISVDCLATPGGNLIIPRYKTSKRYSEVIFSQEVMKLFKREQGRFYLLEVTPRMSGGLQLSCKVFGLDLPSIAINQPLGVEVPWVYPSLERQKVAHIETPICLY